MLSNNSVAIIWIWIALDAPLGNFYGDLHKTVRIYFAISGLGFK